MTIEQAIFRRRSIRGLQGPPLAPAEVERLVVLALAAPAPHHTQPWRFVDVSTGRRAVLAERMGAAWRTDLEHDGVPAARRERLIERSRRELAAAPTLLLGCLVHDGLRDYPDEPRRTAEWTLATHSFGAALQNLLLGASEQGLGAYWISAPLFAQAAVQEALDLQTDWVPQAFVVIGRPDPAYRLFDRPQPNLERHLTRR